MKTENFETQAIRAQTEKTAFKEHATPLFLTSSFTFDTAQEGEALFNGQAEGHIYSRFSNPNVDEFVNKMCLLEKTESGVATATGMAAIFTCFAALLKAGDHVVASKAIFGNSLYILQSILPNYGINHTLVEIDDKEAWQDAITPQTKILFVESPSNPTLKIADLSFLGNLAKEKNLIFCIDNCFATPYLQQPVRFGAHVIIHSATKYIDGQGRVLGGAILGDKKYVDLCYDFIRRTGASLSPFNAWVLSKSLETLAIRMDRHCENAEALYQFLEQHSDIEKIFYPFDKNNLQYNLAKKQQKLGGGLVGCQVKGGKARGTSFLNALKLHSLTANLGDTRSIATHPASTTHSKLSKEQQLEQGITPGFIRFSVGLEHIDDIIADVSQALKNSK
ncbi:MAG: aminotransferase class I/II-fold pyridoxal phosphate-dependent enzyme [Flavobacteriaceae bacterium]|nr:aminotransferase class I/II-fold pyridoxal phosphate-dependent enzyme [Flavobacteriaceae bacterium]